jgi:hypothetical protein
VTITGGTGKSIVPGFQVVFVIIYPFYWTLPNGLTLFCASWVARKSNGVKNAVET